MLSLHLPPALTLALGTLYGLVLGSFGNSVVYRLPLREESRLERGRGCPSDLSNSRSFCPACKHMIAWYDNLPLVSWFALGGHCRHCGEPIPARYVFLEAAGAAIGYGAAAWGGLSLSAALLCCVLLSLLWLGVTVVRESSAPMELAEGAIALQLLFIATESTAGLPRAITSIALAALSLELARRLDVVVQFRRFGQSAFPPALIVATAPLLGPATVTLMVCALVGSDILSRRHPALLKKFTWTHAWLTMVGLSAIEMVAALPHFGA